MNLKSRNAISSNEVSYWGKLISILPTASTIPIFSTSFTIGRLPTNDLQIADARISLIHCIISWREDNTCWVKDKSSNGTFINGKRIPKNIEIHIKNGDEITLLRTERIITESKELCKSRSY